MTNPKQVGDRAVALFEEGFNCCESTLAALAEGLGKRCDCIPSVATGMGGGVGHTGYVCGSITGAAMAVGLAVGKMGLADHTAEKDWANAIVTELVDAFGKQFQTVACRELIDVDLGAADWRERYMAEGCKETCSRFVRFTAEWAASRLAGEGR